MGGAGKHPQDPGQCRLSYPEIHCLPATAALHLRRDLCGTHSCPRHGCARLAAGGQLTAAGLGHGSWALAQTERDESKAEISDSASALRVDDCEETARLLQVVQALALRKQSVARVLMCLEGIVAPVPEEEGTQAPTPALARLHAVLNPVAADEQLRLS